MSKDYSERDLDIGQAKARPRGTLPHLPDDATVAVLQAWLTRALRPPEGWVIESFERAGRDPSDPAVLYVRNGRESQSYRFRRQSDLCNKCRSTIISVTDAKLSVPHLTATEVEDVWVALCRLGTVLTEWDERDETRKWVEQMIQATMPLTGHTLVPDGRHDGLMALKGQGEFTRSDALVLLRPGNADEARYIQRPVRFLDAQTGDQWLRAGELATFVRWVIGVEPMSHANLRARLHEIAVVGRLFEDYRPPHPKLNLYQLPEDLTSGEGK
jgi:hypothetical protein